MPTSPKAETMPGGAPLTQRSSNKRPCKYGPRVDGLCPKKPRASSSTASSSTRSKPSAKKPCKYGERVDGLCPKKPKAAKKGPTVKKLTSVAGASRQAGEVLRSSKATGEQKREAVRVLGTAVAGEATKKVGEHVAREAKKAARSKAGQAAAKKALKKAAVVAGVVPTAAAVGATLYVGAKALKANRSKECKAWAREQLAATEKRLTQKLSADQKATLLRQYEDHCNKKPVTNPFLGK